MNTSAKTIKDSSPDKSGFGMTNSHGIKLTNNFYLEEFVLSQVAERHGYKNEPNEKQVENLKLLCANVLQPLREIINVPIFINSGFRCFDVNAAVGGRFNSQHLEGKAADFVVPSMNLIDVFNIVLQRYSFDQLIYEFGKWIHVSWNGESNRNDVMISRNVHGKTVFEKVVGDQLLVKNEECRAMNENIVIWIIGALVSLVNFLFWSRIKRIEKDVDEAKKKSSAIEKNYLSRFEDLHNKLSEVEKNIIREIYNIKLTAISASASLSTGNKCSDISE